MTGGWPRSWPGSESGTQFGAPPYWGEAHLALDAVVAYVDDELSGSARTRAQDHLGRCRECAAEVVAQYQARTALRGASAPSPSSSLLHNLRAIPEVAELPSPPAGLAIGTDGQFVAPLREPPAGMSAPTSMPAPAARRATTSRRVRLGAGVMVSGLALGALVVGATPSPSGSSGGGTGSPGSVRSAFDAELELGPAGGSAGSGASAGSRIMPTATTPPALAPARR